MFAREVFIFRRPTTSLIELAGGVSGRNLHAWLNCKSFSIPLPKWFWYDDCDMRIKMAGKSRCGYASIYICQYSNLLKIKQQRNKGGWCGRNVISTNPDVLLFVCRSLDGLYVCQSSTIGSYTSMLLSKHHLFVNNTQTTIERPNYYCSRVSSKVYHYFPACLVLCPDTLFESRRLRFTTF